MPICPCRVCPCSTQQIDALQKYFDFRCRYRFETTSHTQYLSSNHHKIGNDYNPLSCYMHELNIIRCEIDSASDARIRVILGKLLYTTIYTTNSYANWLIKCNKYLFKAYMLGPWMECNCYGIHLHRIILKPFAVPPEHTAMNYLQRLILHSTMYFYCSLLLRTAHYKVIVVTLLTASHIVWLNRSTPEITYLIHMAMCDVRTNSSCFRNTLQSISRSVVSSGSWYFMYVRRSHPRIYCE